MTATRTRVVHELLPKQVDYLESNAPEVLYSGAFRAGKSRALCFKLLQRAAYPGARELLCRKTLKSLKGSTLMTLLEPEGELPAVLPPGSYVHNKAEGTIRIKGGGMIQYFGLDDPTKIGSYAGTGVAIDEAVDLTEKDLAYLRGRKSMHVDGLSRQMYMACNPGPPTHPLAERFGLRPGSTAAKLCETIQTTSFDNTFLPADYLDTLRTYTGVYFERYVMGRWVAPDGVIYDRYLESTHLATFNDAATWPRTFITCDDGYSNPFVALRVRIDPDGRAYVERETYKPGLLIEAKVQAIRELGGMTAEGVLVDPAAAQLRAELSNAGFPVIAANNDVAQGILRVQERLKVQEDGQPRLWIDPSCENTRREFGAYSWKEGARGVVKDEPVKEHDHAMDAIRYLVNHVDAGVVQFY